jgi:Acetyltransferase (GNAT) domain
VIERSDFDYLELPYCGEKTAAIAKRFSPYYHCVFSPFVDQSQLDELTAQGFYCRASVASQNVSLLKLGSMKDLLSKLPSKRRNDIVQSVRKAEEQGIEITIEPFRQTPGQFREIYLWYFDVYLPYAATHFANKYKYNLIEDLHKDLLGRFRSGPCVLAIAKWRGQIIGASFLVHIPCKQFSLKSSFRMAFASDEAQGDVLQMSTLNSGSGSVGNINTYLYYRLIEWCITQGYAYFSFGRENLMLPPNEYLNVVGSKRSWGTTTVVENDPASLEFVLCNRNALLHLRSDYFLFSWAPNAYRLIYFANEEKIPKSLSQMLERDSYMDKHVFTRRRSIFSYLEKRALRWKNVVLVLCSANGATEQSLACP